MERKCKIQEVKDVFRDLFLRKKVGYNILETSVHEFQVFHPTSPNAIGLACLIEPAKKNRRYLTLNLWLFNKNVDGSDKTLNQSMTIYENEFDEIPDILGGILKFNRLKKNIH